MPRLFVAVDFPPDVRERIADICFGVPGARWVPMEQLHCTLRFAGEVDDATFDDLDHSLSAIEATRFSVSLRDVGYFPPRQDPRVLWVGLEKNSSLERLGALVENAMEEAGVEPEKRKFHPHVTVARLRERTPPADVAPFIQRNSLFSVHSIQIAEFRLYSSVLTKDGAVHRVESTYPLGDDLHD